MVSVSHASDDEIVALFNSGTLLQTLEVERGEDRIAALRDQLVALNNVGRIDLLAAIDTPEFASLGGHLFFSVQQFFCDAIPSLESPLDRIVPAIERLEIGRAHV